MQNNNSDEHQKLEQIAHALTNKKDKEQIKFLKNEIAHTNDPRTKAKLKKMLQDIIDERKKRQRFALIATIIFVVILFISGYFVFSEKSPKSKMVSQSEQTKVSKSTKSSFSDLSSIVSSQQSQTEQTQSSKVPKAAFSTSATTNQTSEAQPAPQAKVKPATQDTQTTPTSSTEQQAQTPSVQQLTNDQITQWVATVWAQKNGSDNLLDQSKYRIDISRDSNESIIKIEAADRQVDTLDTYRINAQGQLEEAGYYQGQPGKWIVVSDHN